MKKLFGNITGLKANQIRRLENLYKRRTDPEFLISPEILKDICRCSHELRRQIGLLINRQGKIVFVIIGDHHHIVIPDIEDYRSGTGRLKGLRCVHSHLKDEPLTRDDLTDLAMLRLDLIAAATISPAGLPKNIHMGHLLPMRTDEKPYQILSPINSGQLNIKCRELILALEDEIARVETTRLTDSGKERAVLVSVSTASMINARNSMDELTELAESSDVYVVDKIIQHRSKIDSRFLMGQGKLNELTVMALHKGANLLIFDQELSPSQIRSITDQISMRVIDRTQLILDIFARRAQTREGRLQVELAQLKYLLPRLITKNTAMSRLTGGIGGRGPGETKLEINRRRTRDRIKHLEKSLKKLQKQRKQQRAKRSKKGLPIISIIGYTNAGKSTLLNTLTKSNVLAESRLFATLDPSSRRLKFPKDTEVIITDTVGFIRDLPKDLMVAFRATLEELENADLLVHVIDSCNPRCEDHIESVERILADLNLDHIPIIMVFNKMDITDKNVIKKLQLKWNGLSISAIKTGTLTPLLERMEKTANQQPTDKAYK
ncbi:GTPase [Candidatus Magnetomoraceae bacterium gMMP-15]